MLYDVLKSYREYLETKYSCETARTYSIRLCTLFEGQSLLDMENSLDIDKILNNLAGIKHKNNFSQAKNAFLHFCEFQNITLSSDVLDNIKTLENNTRKKYRKLEEKDFSLIDSKIKHIKNRKLKLSYQTILATGLRVSELAGITPNDCLISDNEITFNVVAKGGQRQMVTVSNIEYPKLYQRIKEQIGKTAPDKKLFYSAIYLQKKAKELGFQCHDLRRAYAKLEYKKSKSKTEVMKKLRHTSIKNTNIYIKSKIKV